MIVKCASVFKAVENANRVKVGKSETGVVLGCCSRHGVPLAIVDMHYGERLGYIKLLVT